MRSGELAYFVQEPVYRVRLAECWDLGAFLSWGRAQAFPEAAELWAWKDSAALQEGSGCLAAGTNSMADTAKRLQTTLHSLTDVESASKRASLLLARRRGVDPSSTWLVHILRTESGRGLPAGERGHCFAPGVRNARGRQRQLQLWPRRLRLVQFESQKLVFRPVLAHICAFSSIGVRFPVPLQSSVRLALLLFRFSVAPLKL
mmetsp:Transcript_61084/g.164155  ORF Transcript_61084/g.164155 Transcript_61084/m.164155 type:complete len:203 (+) Transcript_61084:1152-1760(+)